MTVICQNRPQRFPCVRILINIISSDHLIPETEVSCLAMGQDGHGIHRLVQFRNPADHISHRLAGRIIDNDTRARSCRSRQLMIIGEAVSNKDNLNGFRLNLLPGRGRKQGGSIGNVSCLIVCMVRNIRISGNHRFISERMIQCLASHSPVKDNSIFQFD